MNPDINGGPAFPQTNNDWDDETMGISIRDYFAARAPSPPQDIACAMLGTVHESMETRADGKFDGPVASRMLLGLIAKWNYRYADAMLKERAKGGGA